jgi:hypothetical protein
VDAARRLPTTARRGRDRGQTVQDFAIGASVFLLTIAFVFVFIPTLFTPFEDEVDPGLDSQVDRVASAIVDEGSIDGKPNRMTNSTAEAAIIATGSGADLQNAYGLPSTSQVNVTVTPIDPDEDDTVVTIFVGTGTETELASGDVYEDRPAATASRIIVIEGLPECDPAVDASPADGVQGQACRLTVRVW